MENYCEKQLPVKKPSARNYGIDLLRCFAMAMIVMLHTLSKSGLLTETTVGSLKYEIVWFMEIFCYCAVDCFIIISGFVGLNSKFRISRILLLWLQVEFYSVGLTVLMQIVQGDFNLQELLRSLLPVSTNAYWFFTQYFVLSFFMPFINKLVLSMTIRQNGLFVGMMLVFFSLLPMLYAVPVDILGEFNEKIFYTERGYSVLWMIVMYSLGAFINRLVNSQRLDRIKGYVYFLVFMCSDIIIWIIHYLCVNRENKVSQYFVVSYTSPFVVLSAVGMFMFFSKMQFCDRANKLISFFSAGAFSVYLIHLHRCIYPVFKEFVSLMLDMRVLKLIPCLLFTVLFVFFVCTLFDALRERLFKILRIDRLCKRTDRILIVKKTDV